MLEKKGGEPILPASTNTGSPDLGKNSNRVSVKHIAEFKL